MTSPAVVVCTWTARSDPPAEVTELLTLARKVSAGLDADLCWLVVGPASEWTDAIAAEYGVVGIDRIEDAKLAEFQPDAFVEALAQYCAEHTPQVVLFNQTFDARLVAPRLAGRLGSGVVINGLDVEVGERRLLVTASAYGGDTRAVYEMAGSGPHIVTMMPNATQAEAVGEPGPIPASREVQVDLSAVEERIRVVERHEDAGPRLEDASVIVAGGRGLGSPENFRLVEELAEALGGMAGASRPIVDDGWADPARQVGLTGTIAQPALYIAAGISGASQHMVGCSAAKTIVAINRDPDAAIFRHARYGIVGDCLEILPELTRAVKEG